MAAANRMIDAEIAAANAAVAADAAAADPAAPASTPARRRRGSGADFLQ
jgi:hypothetical protein